MTGLEWAVDFAGAFAQSALFYAAEIFLAGIAVACGYALWTLHSLEHSLASKPRLSR
ncbi:MAG TPA: hypothetical protein VN083_12135 [Vicinamibacteria bacterium]|nr:hypothetical protein [Vicinamibacteria bacterium]